MLVAGDGRRIAQPQLVRLHGEPRTAVSDAPPLLAGLARQPGLGQGALPPRRVLRTEAHEQAAMWSARYSAGVDSMRPGIPLPQAQCSRRRGRCCAAADHQTLV